MNQSYQSAYSELQDSMRHTLFFHCFLTNPERPLTALPAIPQLKVYRLLQQIAPKLRISESVVSDDSFSALPPGRITAP